MATKALPSTLSGLFNLKPTPLPFSTGPTNISSTTPQTAIKAPVTPAPSNATLASLLMGPLNPKPVAPAAAPLNSVPVTPGPQGTPVAQPAAPVVAAPVVQAPAAKAAAVSPQFLNADGSFKTPQQVASEVGTTLKAAHGTGDVGTLAGQQFAGGNGGTTADAEAQARAINNTKNDIAVGETDPYKVASQSGIQYTPAELDAIESAYAGIYKPALDTALAKVTDKQASDKAASDSAANLAQIKAQGDETRKTQANAPYTLGANDVRYGADGEPLAVGGGVGGGASTYVPGQDATADAYVKYVQNGGKLTDVPDAYQGLVAQGITSSAAAYKPSKNGTQALSNIQALLTQDGALDAVTGYSNLNPLTNLPGASEAPFRNLLNQLAGSLAVESRGQLKGSGAISDFEFGVLQQAASDLGVQPNGTSNLSADALKAGLQKLQLKLQVGPTNLTDDELLFLNSPAGGSYTPAQIQQYSQSQSFNDVGNTTASTGQNRPQRNNNPGNVKEGGLSDSLAVGKDDQNHLIFPDAATGFKALTADVTAKINGGSKYLPANPTIAQLGKVYAEDPNWPKKVAMMLGVGVDTPTKSVPVAKLVKAIATQEGFYA